MKADEDQEKQQMLEMLAASRMNLEKLETNIGNAAFLAGEDVMIMMENTWNEQLNECNARKALGGIITLQNNPKRG